jgi:FkbM family methyltransferase
MSRLFTYLISLFVGTGIGKWPLISKIYQMCAPHMLGCKSKIIQFENFKIQVVVGNHVSHVITQLLFKNQYEPATSWVFKQLLKKGDVAVDVGANIGYYSLLASSIVGETGNVYAFEPEPNNMRFLKQNIEMNEFKNIQTYQLALSDRIGEAKFHVSDDDAMHSLVKTNEHTSSIAVEVNKLDNIIKGEFKLLKTDTEGNELAVIRGAENIIKRSKCCLIIEVYLKGIAAGGSTLEELWDYINSVGMKKFYVINEFKKSIVNCYGLSDIVTAYGDCSLSVNLLCMKENVEWY